MSDLAHLKIWDDPAIRDSLSWYLDVAENRRPAKFRIAATLATQIDPVASSEDALWAELDRLTPIFLGRWQAIRAGAPLPATAEGPSLLELCRELAYRMLTHCNFCPWNCRVDRTAGAKFGACKLASASRVSSHFHHTGEELFYRGTEGSGTIFFTSCNMRCAFCQNGDISTDKDNGEETDPRTLAAMAWTLRREGCHNINWVGGEVVIHLHAIVDAIALLGRDFTPTSAELRRARRTKADRLFWFDEVPGQSRLRGQVQCADAVEQQLLHNARKHENPARAYRRLAARLQIRTRPMRNGASEDALVLGDGNQEPRTHRRMGRGLFDPPLGYAQSCRVLHLSGAGMDCRARACSAGERDGAVPSRQFLRSGERQVPGQIRRDRAPPDICRTE